MNQKGFAKILLIALIVILAGVTGYFVFIQKDVLASLESKIKAEVNKALMGPLIGYHPTISTGTKLLSVKVFMDTNIFNVTLDFSSAILKKGPIAYEDNLSLAYYVVRSIIQEENKDQKYPEIRFTVMVEGKPKAGYWGSPQIGNSDVKKNENESCKSDSECNSGLECYKDESIDVVTEEGKCKKICPSGYIRVDKGGCRAIAR